MGLFGAIQDIAAQISKTAPTTFDGLTDALRYNADDVARSFAKQEGVKTGRKLGDMRKSLSGLAESSDEYAALASDIANTRAEFRSIVGAYKTGTADAVNEAFSGITGKDKIGVFATAKGYFGDSVHGKTRIKAAAGAVAGVGLGTRYLSGGNLTTNSQGESDIVGIPFV